MQEVFKALADPSRRTVLDTLYLRDGQTLRELCRLVPFSRQGLSKHLQVLEGAHLVVTEFEGREKRHYLNPVPIQEIAERWLGKYAAHQLAAVTELKRTLEGPHEPA